MSQGEPVSVLFADVVGSTRLYERLGDELAHASIGACLRRLGEITLQFRGTVVKTIGDEIMAVFPSPEDAVHAALDMQGASLERPAGEALQLRIGLQHGEVLRREGDVFGDTVNLAARLAALARPAQILTGEETSVLLPAFMRASVRRLRNVAVKGRVSEVSVCEILWRQDGALTLIEAARAAAAPLRLTVAHAGGSITLEEGGDALIIGRDASCDIVLDHPKASRRHAQIEWRGDKFVLVDRSSNGTWVRFDDDAAAILLHLEETILRRSGVFYCGEAPGGRVEEGLRFELA